MFVSRKRIQEDELLDRVDLPLCEMDRSLSDLEWTNRWLGGKQAVFSHIIPLLGKCSDFLDIGCGSGDMLRSLSSEGRGQGLRLNLTGVDLNPSVLTVAESRCQSYPDIHLVKADATCLPFPDEAFDITFSSTFLHHLDPDAAIQALAEAVRVSRRRVVFADLIRSNVGWLGVSIIGKFAFGRLSRYDGRVSFRRAYRPRELAILATQAGMKGFRIQVHRYCRMTLSYDKDKS